jgi:hypothetical protein
MGLQQHDIIKLLDSTNDKHDGITRAFREVLGQDAYDIPHLKYSIGELWLWRTDPPTYDAGEKLASGGMDAKISPALIDHPLPLR